MPSVDNLDFLNSNSLRNYPLKEGVTRISTDSVMVIPNDFLVDFQLAASYDPSKRFYLSRLTSFDDLITVEVSEQGGTLVGTFSIDTANHWQYKDYFLVPTDDYVGATGLLTVTALKGINNRPSGSYEFTFESTEFEPRTIIPSIKGINRMTFVNTNGSSYSMTGDIVIEARQNIRFKTTEVPNTIVIDVGNGLGLNTKCAEETGCIKTINGIPPDESANFTIDFSDCATLTPIPANTGLLLEDICCKPCVGCNDIEELTTRLMTTETGLVTLRQYYTDLSKLLTDFKTTQTYTCDCPPES